MEVKDWLEMATYVFALIGGTVGALLFLKNARAGSISCTTGVLLKAWTNEGDVGSDNTHFIAFELKDIDGELAGSLWTNRYERPLDVNATVGWFSTVLHVSELVGARGTVVSRATIKVSVKGNNNRLAWKVISGNKSNILPRKTVLWPLGP